MAGAGNVKTKQKRTKLTLDRLFSIKKYITETFSVLAKHDKAPPQIERNNTVPKGTGKTVYKKVANNSNKCEDNGSPTPKTTALLDHCTSQTSNESCCLQEVSYVPATHNNIHRMSQTWPHDEYSTHKLGDQFSHESQTRFHLQVFERPSKEAVTGYCQNEGHVGQNSSTQTKRTPLAKNQAIQTDMRDEFDINADIIQYLGQFNDKIAFSVYSPTVYSQCGNGYPYCFEPDYCFYSDAHKYTHIRPTRLSTRRPGEYTQLHTRDQYAQDSMYRPLHEPAPCLAYRQSKRHHGYGISGDQRKQPEFEKVAPNSVDFAWTKNNYSSATSRLDTKMSSEDSGSILSSETDSDFMFYPCSSLTHNMQCMTMIDSRSSNFLSPPTDLPENVSTHFSWRTGFYGSSLDEVTLQFFLDEDALSDDVFLDENELISSADMAAGNDRQASNETAPESAGMYSQLYDICLQSDSDCGSNPGSQIQLRDSYGDNCYAYRYADIDEVLNNYHCMDQQSEMNDTCNIGHSQELGESRYIPASNNADNQCSLADSHQAFGDEFSNVLDSLRRNSTQTKARKMWRQRRAKAKKNSTFNPDKKREQSNNLAWQPAFFTFDDNNTQTHNGSFPPKPLRGILKKKECTSSKRLECETKQQSENILDSGDTRAECPTMFMLEANCRRPPGSPCVYASVHKRLNHTVKLSSVDEVAEVPTEPNIDKTNNNSQMETTSANNEPTDSSQQPEHEATNARLSNVQLGAVEDQQTDPNVQLGAVEDQQTDPSQLDNDNSDHFHVILSSDSDGHQNIITLRKNSLETYEWTRSLQRRHRKKVRRAKYCQDCSQNNGSQIASDQNGLTSSL